MKSKFNLGDRVTNGPRQGIVVTVPGLPRLYEVKWPDGAVTTEDEADLAYVNEDPGDEVVV